MKRKKFKDRTKKEKERGMEEFQLRAERDLRSTFERKVLGEQIKELSKIQRALALTKTRILNSYKKEKKFKSKDSIIAVDAIPQEVHVFVKKPTDFRTKLKKTKEQYPNLYIFLHKKTERNIKRVFNKKINELGDSIKKMRKKKREEIQFAG